MPGFGMGLISPEDLRRMEDPPQRADWGRHRPCCPPYACARVPAKGRGLVATRRLLPGATVLREAPLLTLPLLGLQHTRAMLLATYHQLSQGGREALLAIPGTELAGDEDLGGRLAGILEVYSIRSVEGQGVRRNLYQQASLINHSCEPNMVWYPLQGHIVVRVVREVTRGEELTVSYILAHLAAFTRGNACPTPKKALTAFKTFQNDKFCNKWAKPNKWVARCTIAIILKPFFKIWPFVGVFWKLDASKNRHFPGPKI